VAGRVAILGSSLGALVAAERLSAAGHDVWIFGRRDTAGGRYRGAVAPDGQRFDLGAFALTARSDHGATPLEDFSIDRLDDAARYGAVVERWARQIDAPLIDIEAPVLHVATGRAIPDFLLSRSLTGVGALPESVRNAIVADLRMPDEPAHVAIANARSLRERSLIHFGATLLEACVEPLVYAMTGERTESLAPDAARHLGLYVPPPGELLAAADGRFSGERRQYSDGKMLYRRPAAGTIAQLVHSVMQQLDARPRVRWIGDVMERIETRGTGLVVHVADGVLSFDAWCAALGPARLLPLLGVADAVISPAPVAPATIVGIVVRDPLSEIPLHVAVDTALPVRVAMHRSQSSSGAVCATLDWGISAPSLPDELIARSREAMCALGVAARPDDVAVVMTRRLPAAVSIPTADAIAAHELVSSTLSEIAPSIARLGPASRVLQPSIDEEIVDALAAAESLSERLLARHPGAAIGARSRASAVRVLDPSPDVSLVLVSTGMPSDHTRALHAALTQSVAQMEVVVVPIGSAEESTRVIEHFALRHPEMRITVLAPVAGDSVAQAMHRGVARARGRLLVTMGGEELLVPAVLADAIHRLDTTPELDAVFGDRLVPDGRRTVMRAADVAGPLDLSGRVRAGVVRRTLWDRVGGWRLDALDPARDFWVAAALSGAVGESLDLPLLNSPDAADRPANRMLGHDLEARAEIVVARASVFDPHTVAVAVSLRSQRPIAPLIAAASPARIILDGLTDWGEVRSVEGGLSAIARAWDAAAGHAALTSSLLRK
jgi:hypothetical protein